MSHLRDLFFHFQLHFHHNQSILFKLVFFLHIFQNIYYVLMIILMNKVNKCRVVKVQTQGA